MAPASSRLTYSSLPQEIKSIANNSLGIGVLKSLFDYSKTYHLMIKISDGAFVGFVLYHFEKRKMGRKNYTTGIIDAVCVGLEYRKEGFGTLLTHSVLRKLSAKGVDRVEITLRSPSDYDAETMPNVPLMGSPDLLKAMGFRIIESIPGKYYQASQKYGYECIICRHKPCTCRGVLFAINATD